MMLEDVEPTGFEYDAATDVATLYFGDSGGRAALAGAAWRRGHAKLLVDAAGHLVGVDLDGLYEPRRLVAMLGPHEAVASLRDAEVELADSDGEPAALRIANAKREIRGGEQNPYRP